MTERQDDLDTVFEVRSCVGAHGDSDDVARAFRPAPGELVCLVADGLGQHGGGRTAATIAIETIECEIGIGPVERVRLADHVLRANEAICQAQRTDPRLHLMRTTVAMLHIDGSSAWWLHCGDTRVYAVRDGAVVVRTRDHTVAAMLGEETTSHSLPDDAARLVRSLGGAEQGARPRVLESPFNVREHDRFLVCTDGWWSAFDESELVSSTELPLPTQDDATCIEVRVRARRSRVQRASKTTGDSDAC